MKRSEWAAHAGAVTLSVATLVLALVPLPAAALTQEQIDWCINENHTFLADGQAMGCTAAIQSDKWRGKDLAWAYNNRGIAYQTRATTTAPSPTTTRRSGSIPNMPWPTTTGATRTTTRATTTAPSPTTTRRSGSIPNTPAPTTTGASRTATRVTYDRAIADYNEAIRLDPKDARPTTTGATRTRQGRLDRAIADYNEAIRLDPKYAHGLQQPGQRLRRQGRLRPRHRRLQRGDPARSEDTPGLQQPGRRVRQQGRLRPRHRRLQRGDPARSQFRRAYNNRGVAYAPRANRPRHRRLRRGDPAPSEKRHTLFCSRDCKRVRRIAAQGGHRPHPSKRAQSEKRHCGALARHRRQAQQPAEPACRKRPSRST